MKPSIMIPQPYRDRLINAGGGLRMNAEGAPKATAKRIDEIDKVIAEIRARFPELFTGGRQK